MNHRLSFAFPVLFFLSAAQGAETPYAAVLKKVASTDGVKWSLFGEAERKQMKQASDTMAAEAPSLLKTKDAQLAFWINAHNLCVLRILLDRPADKDVMKIEGFRDQLECIVAGEERTLNDIQSGIIRPLFQEPRSLFALWWGVKGGARLRNEPYDGARLESQLADQVKRAMADPHFVAIDREAHKVTVNTLFDWYKLDFGSSPNAVVTFLKKNLAPKDAKELPSSWNELRFSPFDWSRD